MPRQASSPGRPVTASMGHPQPLQGTGRMDVPARSTFARCWRWPAPHRRRRHHAKVAMAGFCRVHKHGRCAGGRQRGCDLAPDVAAFAHAHDHHTAPGHWRMRINTACANTPSTRAARPFRASTSMSEGLTGQAQGLVGIKRGQRGVGGSHARILAPVHGCRSRRMGSSPLARCVHSGRKALACLQKACQTCTNRAAAAAWMPRPMACLNRCAAQRRPSATIERMSFAGTDPAVSAGCRAGCGGLSQLIEAPAHAGLPGGRGCGDWPERPRAGRKTPKGVRHLGEFGVVFLMFVIGLEFNLPKLRSMRQARCLRPRPAASGR